MASTINSSTSNGIVITPDTSGEIELQANGVTKAKITANGLQDANGASLRGGMYRNLIINGDMRIDQRNAGASVTPTNTSLGIDRWQFGLTQASKFTAQQSSDAPTGFSHSMVLTSSSAYSILSNDIFFVRQKIEGFNSAHLEFGTANAKTVTLSFWVKSSLTGDWGGSLQNSAENRSYPFTYTINSANTWEQKTVTIAGDITGTWIGSTNGIGLAVHFGLGNGSNYSDTAGAWASSQAFAPTSAVSLVGTSGATLYITGVQLEVGSGASDFEFLPYDVQLSRCQRYYEKSFNIATAPANNVYTQNYLSSVPYTDQWVLCVPYIPFKVEKRATPSIVYYGASGKWQVNNTSNNWDTFSTVYSTGQGGSGINTKGMSVTVHNGGSSAYSVSSSRVIRGDWTASAEL